jgi:hypothetical protein
VFFSIVQDDRLPTFSSDGALDFGGDLDEEETKALAPVKVGGAVGGGVGEGKGQIDLVQVDLVFREGKYSSPRDLHSFLHGEYDQVHSSAHRTLNPKPLTIWLNSI